MTQRIVCFLLASLSACFSDFATAQPIVLHYNIRPPLIVVKGEQLTGQTGAPAVAAFSKAGIEFALTETPAARQFRILQNNQGHDCLIGHFKNPEREAYAKFTDPIFQDEPRIALTYAANARLNDGDSIEAVLSDKELSLLVKQSYSYGQALDALIDKHQPIRQSVVVENTQMLRMIAARRADYMFITPHEASAVIDEIGLAKAQFKMVKLENMPKGDLRYILCSKKVPDETIGKLNAAIK